MTQTNFYKKELSFNDYLTKTFLIVAVGVGISALLAFLSSKIVPILMFKNPNLFMMGSLILVIAELGVAIYFSARLSKMSKSTAWICYILYSVLTGLSFSTIVLSYTDATVFLAFASTAIMFACMAIIGHTSKIDFTKIYSIFLPAVLAGFIMSLLNALVFHQAWIDMIIVYAGLILFLIITASDMQRLRSNYYASQGNSELEEKIMIMGAFQLYLDFINLFIRILQIFGRRRNSRD